MLVAIYYFKDWPLHGADQQRAGLINEIFCSKSEEEYTREYERKVNTRKSLMKSEDVQIPNIEQMKIERILQEGATKVEAAVNEDESTPEAETSERAILMAKILAQNHSDTKEMIEIFPDGSRAQLATLKDLKMWHLLEKTSDDTNFLRKESAPRVGTFQEMRDALAVAWEAYDNTLWKMGYENRLPQLLNGGKSTTARAKLFNQVVKSKSLRSSMSKIRIGAEDLRKLIMREQDQEANDFFRQINMPCT